MQEQVFLQEKGVTVTNVRFVVPGQTFAMQGVASIAHHVEEPSKVFPVIMVVIGVVLTLLSFGLSSEPGSSRIVLLLVGSGVIALGIVRFRALKPYHSIVLNASTTTSSSTTVGDVMLESEIGVGAAATYTSSQNFAKALTSTDGEFIN